MITTLIIFYLIIGTIINIVPNYSDFLDFIKEYFGRVFYNLAMIVIVFFIAIPFCIEYFIEWNFINCKTNIEINENLKSKL